MQRVFRHSSWISSRDCARCSYRDFTQRISQFPSEFPEYFLLGLLSELFAEMSQIMSVKFFARFHLNFFSDISLGISYWKFRNLSQETFRINSAGKTPARTPGKTIKNHRGAFRISREVLVRTPRRALI